MASAPPRDRAPQPVPAQGGETAESWQANPETAPSPRPRRRWGHRLLLGAMFFVPLAVVATLLAISILRPKPPYELVAREYLQAVTRNDWVEANRLSVLAMHPRLEHVGRVWAPQADNRPVTGMFVGLAEFHRQTLEKYTYDPRRERFELNDTLGAGMELLSKLEGVTEQLETETGSGKTETRSSRRRTPEDAMLDDVLSRYGAIANLASAAGGLLSSSNLSPTYADLLNRSDVALTPAERALADHYLNAPAKWDQLLGRSFLTLPGNVEFQLHEVALQATVHRAGQSPGEPGTVMRLRLIRFVMGTIDTGWRVWEAAGP